MENSQKHKNRAIIIYRYTIPKCIPKGNQSTIQKRYQCTHVYCNSSYELSAGDGENMVHIHKGVLVNDKEELNGVICRKMDGTRGYHVKKN
jgi:hypothetical protein